MPNILEIALACCQDKDDPRLLAGLTHELRYDCFNYEEALKIPAPMHLAKQIEEYSIYINDSEEFENNDVGDLNIEPETGQYILDFS